MSKTSLYRYLETVANIGVTDQLVTREAGKIRLINVFSLVSVLSLTVYAPLFYSWGITNLVWVSAMQWICYVISILLNKVHRYRLSKLVFIFQLSIATMAFGSIMGEGVQLQLFYIPIISLSIVLFNSQEPLERVLSTIFPIICFVVLEFEEYSILPTHPMELGIVNFMRWTIFVVVLILNWLVINMYSVHTERAEKEISVLYDDSLVKNQQLEEKSVLLAHQRDEIQENNRNIMSSINYAQRIQEAILPTNEEIKRHLPDSFIFYRPRDIVSGDFYWMAELHNKLYVAAVDCTGHGVPGAFMSLIGATLLQEIIVSDTMMRPGNVLTTLNEQIVTSLRQSSNDNKDGMDMSLCVIDKEKRMLSFSGARNPLYYVQKGSFGEILADRVSIGGIDEHKQGHQFTSHEMYLDGPTTIYMFSDGYQDQFGGEREKKFSRRKFKALIDRIGDAPIADQYAKVSQEFYQWKGEHSQVDDVLVMGFRI